MQHQVGVWVQSLQARRKLNAVLTCFSPALALEHLLPQDSRPGPTSEVAVSWLMKERSLSTEHLWGSYTSECTGGSHRKHEITTTVLRCWHMLRVPGAQMAHRGLSSSTSQHWRPNRRCLLRAASPGLLLFSSRNYRATNLSQFELKLGSFCLNLPIQRLLSNCCCAEAQMRWPNMSLTFLR